MVEKMTEQFGDMSAEEKWEFLKGKMFTTPVPTMDKLIKEQMEKCVNEKEKHEVLLMLMVVARTRATGESFEQLIEKAMKHGN